MQTFTVGQDVILTKPGGHEIFLGTTTIPEGTHGKVTFIVDNSPDKGFVQWEGYPHEPSELTVLLAHFMEVKVEEIDGWAMLASECEPLTNG